jgi:hypothetical protein
MSPKGVHLCLQGLIVPPLLNPAATVLCLKVGHHPAKNRPGSAKLMQPKALAAQVSELVNQEGPQPSTSRLKVGEQLLVFVLRKLLVGVVDQQLPLVLQPLVPS